MILWLAGLGSERSPLLPFLAPRPWRKLAGPGMYRLISAGDGGKDGEFLFLIDPLVAKYPPLYPYSENLPSSEAWLSAKPSLTFPPLLQSLNNS